MNIKIGVGIATPRRAAASGAPAFSPSDLAGLVMWYDPSDAANRLLGDYFGSEVIYKLKNKAVVGTSDMATVEGADGDYSTSPYTGAINGHKALDLNAGQGYLECTDLVFGTNPAVSVFGVVSAEASGQGAWIANGGIATATMFGLIPRDRCTIGAQVADLGVAPGLYALGVPQIRSVVRPAGTSKVITVYVNGTSRGTSASGNAATSVKFGCLGTSQSNYGATWWPGKIGEVLVYTAALSNTDRGKVETYLSAKWGIALA